MEIDQYAFCPCGSGKKFKWCCQNIYRDIEHAYEQLEQGQVEVALRIMSEATKKNPQNPEVWGQQAQVFLYAGQKEQAEQSLQHALDLNPTYPFGLLLQARLRSDEGEFGGALILARRAAEAYHPEAVEYLAQVYALIFQLEMRRNRPLAAHAALRILIRCQPGEQELRDALEETFGPKSALPACARAEYSFLSPSATLADERRQSWDRVLTKLDSPQLNTLAAAFEQLTTEDATDAAAWFNLALAQAWLGENRKSLDALEKYYPLEEDETRAARAAALAEVLLCCRGLENESDYRQYAYEYRYQDMTPLAELLQEWQDAGLLIAQQSEAGDTLTAMVLLSDAPSIVTSATATARPDRRLGGYLVLVSQFFRIWGPNEDAINRLREQIKSRTALSLTEGPLGIGPANFGDVVSEALLFPGGEASSPEDARSRILEAAQKHFEEIWIHRPLKALTGNTPIDASGHSVLRKKLLGVIQFMQDCAAIGILSEYDFNRLRHKLGLTAEAPAAAQAPAAASGADVGGMNTAELAALNVEGLSDEQLEKAYQAAQKLDAGEVAERLARALIARPIPAERRPTDRYTLFSFLHQRAVKEGNMDAALDHVNEGERQDCEYNEGRRRNDYELRRGQVHVKRREADQAQDVFTRLIERSPDNLKYRGAAAEGMLSLRQSARAIAFAEEGLEIARRQQDRDTEEHLMELLEAAKRQS
jgi:Tfp pilus assembly protein PilF